MHSVRSTAREVFVGRTSLNKTERSHDFGVKSLTRQNAINKTETAETSPTLRSNLGSAKPRVVFSKWATVAKPQTISPYDYISETHSASQNRTRGGETMECNVGVATASRLQSWQATSCVLFASPFFRHTGASETSGSKKLHNCLAARVRSLKNEPIIEFSVGFV